MPAVPDGAAGVVLGLFLAAQDAQRSGGERLVLDLAGIGAHRRDPLTLLADGLRDVFKAETAAGKEDAVHPAADAFPSDKNKEKTRRQTIFRIPIVPPISIRNSYFSVYHREEQIKTAPAAPCTFNPSVPGYPQKAAFTIILP